MPFITIICYSVRVWEVIFYVRSPKWANIKHKKGKADALKGQVFTNGRELIVAVKMGGGPNRCEFPAENCRVKQKPQHA